MSSPEKQIANLRNSLRDIVHWHRSLTFRYHQTIRTILGLWIPCNDIICFRRRLCLCSRQSFRGESIAPPRAKLSWGPFPNFNAGKNANRVDHLPRLTCIFFSSLELLLGSPFRRSRIAAYCNTKQRNLVLTCKRLRPISLGPLSSKRIKPLSGRRSRWPCSVRGIFRKS